MTVYEERALEGASAVDLVVALYDGILRFLQLASGAARRGDAKGRRLAVKRALDIVLHLQSRLRMDIGGKPAEALSDFYASIFAQILQASQAASVERFESAIRAVRNVRDAWKVVAQEGRGMTIVPVPQGSGETAPSILDRGGMLQQGPSESPHWTA